LPDRLDRILLLSRSFRPGLRLVDRHEVWWMRLGGELMRPVVPGFNERFTTVIGDTVYLPAPAERLHRDGLAALLAHELVHQLDQRDWGPWFYASYVATAPIVRTARAVWERRAYAVDFMLAYEVGGTAALDGQFERVVRIFAGPSYLWMWAGRRAASRFLEPVREAVRQGRLQTEPPYDRILGAWRGDPPPGSAPGGA